MNKVKFGKKIVEIKTKKELVKSLFNKVSNQYDLMNDLMSFGLHRLWKKDLIQNIDRKLPFEDIANAKGIKIKDLIEEMETIVFSGTKLNINYYLDEIFDDDQLNELYDYFIESDSDSIKYAEEAFKGDYDEEELRLYRIKFMSEIAN